MQNESKDLEGPQLELGRLKSPVLVDWRWSLELECSESKLMLEVGWLRER